MFKLFLGIILLFFTLNYSFICSSMISSHLSLNYENSDFFLPFNMALILHVLQCVHSRYDYYKSHHVVNVVCRVNYGNVTLHVKVDAK